MAQHPHRRALGTVLLLVLVTGCSGFPLPGDEPSRSAPAPPLATPEPETFAVDVLPPVVQPGTTPESAADAVPLLTLAPQPGTAPIGQPRYLVTAVGADGRTDVTNEIAHRGTLAWLPATAGTYEVARVDLPAAEQVTVHVDHARWQLVLDDEFDSGLAPEWETRAAAVQETCDTLVEGADQHSRNRNDFADDQVRVVDGVAVLGVTDRSRSETCEDGRILRSSGHIGTGETLRLGGTRHVIAARIKMPEARGPHAAFWMRGIGPATKRSTARVSDYEDQAEMDIVESYGASGRGDCRPEGDVRHNAVAKGTWSRLQANFYYNWDPVGGYRHCIPRGQLRRIPGLAAPQSGPWDGYHVYAVDWVPGRYYRVWYDGVLIKTYRGPELSSARESFIVLSLLINDGATHYRGPKDQKYIEVDGKEYDPGAAHLTPADLSAMKVDWVRVWAAG